MFSLPALFAEIMLVITFWATFHDINLTYIGKVFTCSSMDSVGVMNKLILVPAKVTTESVCWNILSVTPCFFSVLVLNSLSTRMLNNIVELLPL